VAAAGGGGAGGVALRVVDGVPSLGSAGGGACAAGVSPGCGGWAEAVLWAAPLSPLLEAWACAVRVAGGGGE
jgi:hypothetical protein